MDVYVGTIMTFGFNYAPSGWSLCAGQTLPIAQYNALFALLGVVYGGNGTSNFQLPNLQGRVPIGQGNGINLTPRVIGQASGAENVSLTVGNLPIHTPVITATATSNLTGNTTINLAGVATSPASAPSPTNAFIGASGTGPGLATIYSTVVGTTPVPLQGVSTAIGGTVNVTATAQPIGNSLPSPVMNPFLALNFSIALNGIYPSRN